MKTQRTPDKTRAEYCLIPLTHKASPYRHRAEVDVRKTWLATVTPAQSKEQNMKYDHPKHPNFADWSAGLSDGGDTNPYREPGNRTGEALDAYHAGFDYALDGMEDYDPDFPE